MIQKNRNPENTDGISIGFIKKNANGKAFYSSIFYGMAYIFLTSLLIAPLLFPRDPYSTRRRCNGGGALMKSTKEEEQPIIKFSPNGLRIAEINYEICGVAGDGLNIYLDFYHKGDNENKRTHGRVLDLGDIDYDRTGIKWLDNQTLEVDLPIKNGAITGKYAEPEIYLDHLPKRFEEVRLIYKNNAAPEHYYGATIYLSRKPSLSEQPSSQH